MSWARLFVRSPFCTYSNSLARLGNPFLLVMVMSAEYRSLQQVVGFYYNPVTKSGWGESYRLPGGRYLGHFVKMGLDEVKT